MFDLGSAYLHCAFGKPAEPPLSAPNLPGGADVATHAELWAELWAKSSHILLNRTASPDLQVHMHSYENHFL
jgi:hypothetical protein